MHERQAHDAAPVHACLGAERGAHVPCVNRGPTLTYMPRESRVVVPLPHP